MRVIFIFLLITFSCCKTLLFQAIVKDIQQTYIVTALIETASIELNFDFHLCSMFSERRKRRAGKRDNMVIVDISKAIYVDKRALSILKSSFGINGVNFRLIFYLYQVFTKVCCYGNVLSYRYRLQKWCPAYCPPPIMLILTASRL